MRTISNSGAWMCGDGMNHGLRKAVSERIEYLCDPHNGENLFLIGFAIYQVMCMWDTTMFPFPFWVEFFGKALALGLAVTKILFYGRYSPFKLIGFIIAGGCTAIIAYTTGYIPPFVWIVFLAASQNVSFRKTLEIYLLLTGAGMIMAYAASMIGVIENLQYITEKRGIRNSFGIIYTTDFAAHIFYMLLIWFFLAGEKLKGYHYFGAIGVAVLIYLFCNARLDSISILATALLFWMGNFFTRSRHIGERLKGIWEKGWKAAGPFLMPACMTIAVGMTYEYGMFGKSNQILKEINRISGGRLRLGWQSIEQFGIHLFGRNVPMVGNGGTTKKLLNYSFVDSSYVNVLLRAGIVFMLAVLILYALSCRVNSHDLYFLYVVALISVNCIVAHHLIEPAYNPFLLAAFTRCARNPGDGDMGEILGNRLVNGDFVKKWEGTTKRGRMTRWLKGKRMSYL